MIMVKPHLNIIAIHALANPTIDPIERSNSPAIISKPAPSAIIPSCYITRRLFLIPRALNPSPANGFNENSPVGIEKYPNIPNKSNITPRGPISGLLTSEDSQPLFSNLSASCRAFISIKI